MFVVTYRKLFYAFSILLVVGSIFSVSRWGLNPGIDFKGGAILEIEYATSTVSSQTEIMSAVEPLGFSATVRATGENGYIIKMKDISQEEKNKLMLVLKSFGELSEKRFDSVGPLLGTEALKKSFASIAFVLIAIVLFIAFAFRKVSEPVSSWKYGIVAIIALIHDVIVPTGVFAILGHFKGYEVDTLFVTALLVVLGFSIHDTIVVFDRVRENLSHSDMNKKNAKSFDQIVGESINQTFTRSINTSLTTLLALIVLYFVGGESTQHFSLALIIGIAAGTYSSVFIGSPLLVTVWKWQEGRKNKGGKK